MSMPASISIIRHAEKQLGDGPPRGVLVDGTSDPDSLTPRGWQRAGALVGLFVRRIDQSGDELLPTPTRLFASEIGPHSHSRRPLETLQPLSDRLGLPLDEPFLQDELDQLVQAIRACDGHVLVAWEHKRIPLIANRLVGDGASVPQVWPDERFDVVWVFEPEPGSGRFRLRQVPQLLLAGDRAEPIA
jgi:broad specificity phosphatase PhoE